MTWLAPWYLAAGAAGAIAIVVLHLIALERPHRYLLPTARFVPPAAARAASLTRRPTDLLLLLLRAAAMLLLGAAFARPVLTPARAVFRQVVLVDVTDAAASVTELRDSALAHAHPGDAIILLDSLARPGSGATLDLLGTTGLVRARASLAAGLVSARRSAATLADSTDSVRIVVVSPFASESVENDSSLILVRAGWPGAIRLVAVKARTGHSLATPVRTADDRDDPLAAGVRLAGAIATVPASLARGQPLDSAWVRDGGVALAWPLTRPDGWNERPVPDTVGAIVADGGRTVLVAPFERRWTAPAGATVVARWIDGEPAAVEQPLGAGCVRTVGVPLPTAGDLTLRPEFAAMLESLTADCGGRRDPAPLGDEILRALAGTGSATVPVDRLRQDADRSTMAPWLLALAVTLLILEWAIRGRVGGGQGQGGEVANSVPADATDHTSAIQPSGRPPEAPGMGRRRHEGMA